MVIKSQELSHGFQSLHSILFSIFQLQHKNSASHSSHRGKSSARMNEYEQILTPILDMSPSKERNVDQRKLRKAKSQVSFILSSFEMK